MCWEGREQGVFPIGVESDGSELMQPCLPKYISALQPCLPEYISAPQHISELAAQPTFWKRSPLLRVAHSLLGPSSYSHFPPGSLELGMGWGRWEGVPSDQLLGLARPQAWNRGRKSNKLKPRMARGVAGPSRRLVPGVSGLIQEVLERR